MAGAATSSPFVQDLARSLVRESGALDGPVRYIALGIDLKARSGRTHIETSVLCDTKLDDIVATTGKSYPTTGQQETLVRNPASASHFTDVDGHRAVTLVCHDLSIFNPRGRAVRRGLRAGVGDEVERMVAQRRPTVALHQAHTVENPMTWTGAWNAFLAVNPDVSVAWATAFRYSGFNGVEPKSSLSRKVLDRTRGGDVPAIDIVLSSPETARRLT